MKCNIKNLENKKIGDVVLTPEIFNLPIRKDILSRVVNWQLSKRRSGNHKTKGISEVRGTTKKPFKQKGTGKARQGSLRSPQFKGGSVIFGPVVRSHAFKLPKKVVKLGLKIALSTKAKSNLISVIDSLKVENSRTSDLKKKLQSMGIINSLIVTNEIDENFFKASSNIFSVDVISQDGINVYDILRHDHLVLTKGTIEHLESKLL